jgi:transcriptional regulator with XRE-family HTH domain
MAGTKAGTKRDVQRASPRRDPVQRKFVGEVAAAVRNMRASAGLTQEQLARLVGTSQPTIGRLENAIVARTPQWDTLRRIATALGWHLQLVFTEPQRGLGFVQVDKPSPKRRRIVPPPPRLRPQKPFSLDDLEPPGAR